MEYQLLDWSLRAALMAAGTSVALFALRIRTPAARHAAWTGVLVAMLLLPVMTTWGPKARLPVLPAAREQLTQGAPAPDGMLMRPQSAEDRRTRTRSPLAPVTKPRRQVMNGVGQSQTWEKRRQALLDEVQKLTPDQAEALEEGLKANPRDRDRLIKLVRYYQIKLGGQGFSKITLWYIEREPTFPWAWNINPEWDREGYEQGKRVWLAHLKKPGAEAAIYRNAARFLEGGDKPLAEQILLDGQKAYPNERWTRE